MIHQNIGRTDVTVSFNNKFNFDSSGFSLSYNTTNLPKGKYLIAIYIKNNQTKKEGLVITDKFIDKF